jgi:hypothetical protein
MNEGRERKRKALDRHEEYRAALLLKARREFIRRGLSGKRMTTDDIRYHINIPDGVDPSFLGAVPKVFANAGIINRIGYEPSGRAEAHTRPISVWKVVQRGAALAWLACNPEPCMGEYGQGELAV